MNKVSFSLTQKALLAVLAILLPIFVTFYLTYSTNKEHLDKFVLNDILVLAESYEGHIYHFLESSKNRAEDFSSDGYIQTRLEAALKGDTKAAGLLARHLKTNKIVLDSTIRAIDVVSRDGKVIASTDSRAYAFGRPLAEIHFGGAFPMKELLKAPVVIEDHHGHEEEIQLAVSAPVLSKDRTRVLGAIINYISIEELNMILSGRFMSKLGAISWNRGRSETLKSYIVNREKILLTEFSSEHGVSNNQVVDTAPVRQCIENRREMEGFYTNYLGVEVVGASMCLPVMGWTLMVEVDKDVALAPLKTIQKWVLITGIIVFILIVLLFYMFINNVVGSLRRLQEAADTMSRGDFSVEVLVEGTDEIAVLTDTFNKMARDINTRTFELERSRGRLAEAQRIANMGNWEWDLVNNTLWWSDEVYKIFGVKPEDFSSTYEAFLAFVHPDDLDYVKTSVDNALLGQVRYSIDHRIVLRDGTVRMVAEQGEAKYDETGKPVKMVGTVRDVTGRRKAEADLKNLYAAIDQSVNVVFITNTKGVIEYVNNAFEQVTGYPRSDAIGRKPSMLSSGETPQSEYDEMWQTILDGRTWRGTFKNKKKNGEFYWGSTVITPVEDDKGRLTHFLAVQEDITEKMRSEERMIRLATRDPLTGLSNRAHFIKLMNEWIDYAGSTRKGALLLVDIDRLNLINDTYGHATGDNILRRTATLLDVMLKEGGEHYFKESDGQSMLGRLAGDEFAIFLPYLDSGSAVLVAEHLRRMIEEFRFTDSLIHMTVTIGVVASDEKDGELKDVFKKADAAMLRAKEQGGNRCHLYSDDDRILEQMHSRLQKRTMILKAIEEDRFEPWFQSILDIKTGEVQHYEVLARLRDQSGEILTPGAFIDAAEAFDIIDLIDKQIVRKAMTLLKEFTAKGKSLTFCMNLSGKYFGDIEFLDFLREIIDETGVSPEHLVFEITETAAVHDMELAVEFVNELKELGCRFSLDDFGVGYTSFHYLKRLHVDYIKIDGSFVRRIHEDENDRLFVGAIADVARGLNVKTVAEYVENGEILEVLKDLDIDYAQGYHLSKPEPASDLRKALFGIQTEEG